MGEKENGGIAGGGKKGQVENQPRGSAVQGGEPLEATLQPPTDLPNQIGRDEGESAEVEAPLVQKKRRLVKLGEAAPTNEASQAGEAMRSGVLVWPLEQ